MIWQGVATTYRKGILRSHGRTRASAWTEGLDLKRNRRVTMVATVARTLVTSLGHRGYYSAKLDETQSQLQPVVTRFATEVRFCSVR